MVSKETAQARGCPLWDAHTDTIGCWWCMGYEAGGKAQQPAPGDESIPTYHPVQPDDTQGGKSINQPAVIPDKPTGFQDSPTLRAGQADLAPSRADVLREALEQIALYDVGNGCCTYGCDTPAIAKAALLPGTRRTESGNPEREA